MCAKRSIPSCHSCLFAASLFWSTHEARVHSRSSHSPHYCVAATKTKTLSKQNALEQGLLEPFATEPHKSPVRATAPPARTGVGVGVGVAVRGSCASLEPGEAIHNLIEVKHLEPTISARALPYQSYYTYYITEILPQRGALTLSSHASSCPPSPCKSTPGLFPVSQEMKAPELAPLFLFHGITLVGINLGVRARAT